MQRIGAAEYSRQGLNGRANDVVVGLLGRERDACRLRMAAHHPGAWILSAVALAHELRPQASPGAELGNLLEEVVVYVEEEGQARCELIDLQASLEGSIYIRQAVRNGEGQLLYGSCSGLANMVTTDADGIPAWHVARAKFDGIRDQAQRWFGREKKLFLCAVLLEYVVLQRTAKRSHGVAILLGIGDIHGPDYGCRAIYRHGGGDFIERQVGEEHFHIGQRGDGDTTLAKLARRQEMISVVAVECWHIERCREARLTLLEQILEARIGILRGAIARKHAHCPGFRAVHGWLHTTCIGIFAWKTNFTAVVQRLVILRCIDEIDRHAGGGHEVITLRHALLGFTDRGFLPVMPLDLQTL